MPNIREQRVDEDGIYIVASDGRSFSLTRAEAIAHFKGQSGTRAKKRQVTIDWVKQSIEAALGAEQVPMRIRRTPMKPNPLHGQPDEPEFVPDHANAFDEDAIELDFDDAQGFKHLGVRG